MTAVPKPKWGIVNAADDKIKWCKKYLGSDVKVNICHRREKQNFVKGRYSILIDDLAKNIEEWQHQSGTGILFKDAKSFSREAIDLIAKPVGLI